MDYLESRVTFKGWHYQKKKGAETINEMFVDENISVINRSKFINGMDIQYAQLSRTLFAEY